MTELVVLRDLGLVVAGAALLLLAARPLRVPPILTYMVAGLALGPAAGLLDVSASVHLFSELGVALLLFVVGLELSIAKIRDIGRVALVAGTAQVALTFGLGFGLGRLFGLEAAPATFFGLTAAFSSTVVVVKLLDRTGDLDTLHGRLAVGILLVQDVLVAVVLTLVSGLAGAGAGAHGAEAAAAGSPWLALATSFAGLAAVTALGAAAVRWVLPALFDWLGLSTEALFVAALTWAFAFILAAESLHVSVELGAFIAGVLLAQLHHNHELRRRVHPLVNFFLAVFFVALGARLDPGAMLRGWPAALGLTAIALVAKPALVAILLRRLGQPADASLRAGLTLGQVSEFAFILAGSAIAAGILEPDFLGIVGLVGLVTFGVSAALVPRSDGLVARLAGGPARSAPAPSEGVAVGEPGPGPSGAGHGEGLRGHVIVVGMNTLGRAVVERLAEAGEVVMAVDTDPAKLAGLPAHTFAGPADDARVLREVGLDRARLLVSALQIEDVNGLLAYRCRALGVPAAIHAFDPSLVFELLEIGADHVMISKFDGIREMEAALRGAMGPGGGPAGAGGVG